MLKNEPFLWEVEATRDRACLMLHGLGGGVYEMQLLGDYLYQRGLTVQGINYPGHDRPSPKMPASTWEQWYGHALATYQALAQRYQAISLVGFSTGCPLALHLAANYPVERLVLLSPYFAIRCYWYLLVPPEVYLHSFLGKWIADLPRLALPIRDRAMRQQAEAIAFFQSFNLSAVRSASELIALAKAELPTIQSPTLIIQSPKDTVVDPSGAKLVYNTLGSAEKRLHWLRQSDHIISLDVEREEVFQEVGCFLGLPT
ncbi:MAG: alpha/beta fold hydrolase [Cyanobacteria bacterium]|nr:alpha/beta fold hydrolase [Cyanobacteriota bacterium]MDW8200129.1 alpha/beta fold hydrolase [Cyanobacteriota bacterium SKYGB_h_bin112]